MRERRARPAATARGRRLARTLSGLALILGLLVSSATPVAACSPPFEPTIGALGPAQIVLLGTTGEPVLGGRLFHVERAWNAPPMSTPIVIAFKEGAPVGDCSYHVPAGWRIVVAPLVEGNRLHVDLGTLQAPADTSDGAAYVAEAEQLFGVGEVPPPGANPPTLPQTDDGPSPQLSAAVVIGGALCVGMFAVGFALRRRLSD